MSESNTDSFAPGEFGSQLAGDPTNGSESSLLDETPKGIESLEVDLDTIGVILSNLRKIESKKVEDLKGADKADFDKIIAYVNMLYDTAAYNALYTKIVDVFGSLKRIKVGTVGAYFVGCIIADSVEGSQNCNAVCASGVPKPKGSDGWSVCDKAVILGTYSNGAYDFKYMNNIDNKKHSILYVNCGSYSTCPVFKDKDKEALRNMGVELVTLYGYRGNGTESVQMSDTPMSVDELKSTNSSSSNNPNVVVIGIVVVVFIMILYLYSVRKS